MTLRQTRGIFDDKSRSLVGQISQSDFRIVHGQLLCHQENRGVKIPLQEFANVKYWFCRLLHFDLNDAPFNRSLFKSPMNWLDIHFLCKRGD